MFLQRLKITLKKSLFIKAEKAGLALDFKSHLRIIGNIVGKSLLTPKAFMKSKKGKW